MSNNAHTLACMAALLAVLASCSDDDGGGCPQCPTGQVCDTATNTCVPDNPNTCPAAGCGANASCRSDGTCSCQLGWSDCNLDLGTTGGNGCECDKACNGLVCGTSGCDATQANACGNRASYCNAGTCTPCPPGKYNCDGINDCEASQPCNAAFCSPTTKDACGTSQYCASGACTPCPTGKYNCDGINDCESSTACGATGSCVQECMDQAEYKCVKNPAQNKRCEECLNDTHCKDNPRSNGPTCDATDLAGTGWNFCICATNADCATSTVGKVCKAATGVPNPKLKTCTCNTDADCPAPYTICEGSLFKRCQKRCATNADCLRNSIQGTCDTKTGKCDFSSYP